MSPIIGINLNKNNTNNNKGSSAANVCEKTIICDSNDSNFINDVVETSKSTPVIVDFYSPNSSISKEISPILEKIIIVAAGAVKLVKINIDENQQMAAQLRVQSVPTIFGFINGQSVDAFAGAKTAIQIKEFVKKLVKTAGGDMGDNPIDEYLSQAKEFFANLKYQEAGQLFGEAIKLEPDNPIAAAGLIKSYIKLNAVDAAKNVIDQIDDDIKKMPEMLSALSLYNLSIDGDMDIENQKRLLNHIEKNSDNYQARFDYAISAFAMGNQQQAIDYLLYIISRDIEWNEQAARKKLLEFLTALGQKDPLALTTRRRLSSLLFR